MEAPAGLHAKFVYSVDRENNKLTIALEIAVGGSASCDHTTFTAADVSGDGKVTSLDAMMILQKAAGAIEIC